MRYHIYKNKARKFSVQDMHKSNMVAWHDFTTQREAEAFREELIRKNKEALAGRWRFVAQQLPGGKAWVVFDREKEEYCSDHVSWKDAKRWARTLNTARGLCCAQIVAADPMIAGVKHYEFLKKCRQAVLAFGGAAPESAITTLQLTEQDAENIYNAVRLGHMREWRKQRYRRALA